MLNRLDGWERLSVVVGVLLALLVAFYAPQDETGILKKVGTQKAVPWYGVVVDAKREMTDEEVFGKPGVVDPFDNQKPAPWEADPVVAGKANVFDQFDAISFLDARLISLFMVLVAVLPFALLSVIRWIAAGFKQERA